MAAASARALAALKLFRLFSRCPNGNVGIPAFVSAEFESLDFPADADRLGEPFCDFIPAEPADAGRALAFSDIVTSQSFRSNPRPELGCNTLTITANLHKVNSIDADHNKVTMSRLKIKIKTHRKPSPAQNHHEKHRTIMRALHPIQANHKQRTTRTGRMGLSTASRKAWIE